MTIQQKIVQELKTVPVVKQKEVLDFLLSIKNNDYVCNDDTEYLSSIPGMRESIIKASKEKLEDGASLADIGWE